MWSNAVRKATPLLVSFVSFIWLCLFSFSRATPLLVSFVSFIWLCLFSVSRATPLLVSFFFVKQRHCLCFHVLFDLAQHADAVFARISDHGRRKSQFSTPPSYRSSADARLHGKLCEHRDCTDSRCNRHTVASCVCICASHPIHSHKTTTAGTFHSVHELDGIEGDAEHEVPEPEDAQRRASLVTSVKTRSGQDTICQYTFHDVCFCLTRHHKTSHRRRGYLPLCHLHSAFFSDRARGTRTCRHPCSAFFSDRMRGSNTCRYIHMTNQLQCSSTCLPHLLSSMQHHRQ